MHLITVTSRPFAKNNRKYKQSFLKRKSKFRLSRTHIKLTGSNTPSGLTLNLRSLESYKNPFQKRTVFKNPLRMKKSYKLLKRHSYKVASGSYSRKMFFSFHKPKKLTVRKSNRLIDNRYWISQLDPVQFSNNTALVSNFFRSTSIIALFKRELLSATSTYQKLTTLLPAEFVQNSNLRLENHETLIQPMGSSVDFTWLQLHNLISTFNWSIVKKVNSLKKKTLFQKRMRATSLNWSRYKWMSKKKKLAFWNKKFKNSFLRKRPSIYFSYSVPTSFRNSKFTRKFIPELPFALRGSFWSKNINTTSIQPFEVINELSSYQLLRTSVTNELDNPQLTSSQRKLMKSWSAKLFFKKLKKRKKKKRLVISLRTRSSVTPVRSGVLVRKYLLKSSRSLALHRSRSLIIHKIKRTPRGIVKRSDFKKSDSKEFFKKKSRKKRTRKFLKRRVTRLVTRYLSLSRKKIRAVKYSIRKSRTRKRKLRLRRNKLFRNTPRLLNSLSVMRLSNSLLRSLLRRRRHKTTHIKKAYTLVRPKSLTRALKSGVRKFLRKANRSFYHTLLTLSIPSLFTNRLFTPQPLLKKIQTSDRIGQPESGSLVSLAMVEHLSTLLTFWNNSTLLKWLLVQQRCDINPSLRYPALNLKRTTESLQNQMSTYYFGTRAENIKSLNTWTVPTVNYRLRKKLLRIATGDAFVPKVTAWYYQSLIRFMENCTGRKVALHIGPFVDNVLTFEDKALCNVWASRVKGFQRILGHKIFVAEAVDIVASSLRLKDPTFLSNWICAMLKRMSFWKFRLLFRYLKFLITHLFQIKFQHFQFKGFKLRLKGKISVAGNARTRALHLRVGRTSHSTMNNRVAYDLSYVGTFTGVLGLKLWFFY